MSAIRTRLHEAFDLPRGLWHRFRSGRVRLVAVPLDAHRSLYVDAGDRRGRKLIAARGTFNVAALECFQVLLAEHTWDRVVDVGANYGEMTLAVGAGQAHHLYACEPNPRVARCLAESVHRSGSPARVVEVALGHRAGTAVLHLDVLQSGLSHLHRSPRPGEQRRIHRDVRVAVSTLDDLLVGDGFLAGESLLVKIDVEGTERAVIDGAFAVLRDAADLAVMFEVAHLSPDDLAHIVAAVGGSLQGFDRETRTFVAVDGPASARAAGLHAVDLIVRRRAPNLPMSLSAARSAP